MAKNDERRRKIEDEEAELSRREKLIEERKLMVKAFRPFEDPEEYTKNEASAIFDMRGLTLDAVEKVARNFQRELSNKAMVLDGIARDKPMWMSLGAYMLVENLKKKIKTFEKRDRTETVKEEVKKKMEPKSEKRSVLDLYNNPGRAAV